MISQKHGPLNLAHIPLVRKEEPFYINISTPIPQKVQRIPNIDPLNPGSGTPNPDH